MDIQKRNAQIANSYYNLGLEKAKLRDLSGAAQSLKDSLHFNKYQTDARNLLGLIYYESGEVSDALVQWVISLNLQPEKNLADHYLDEIQRKHHDLKHHLLYIVARPERQRRPGHHAAGPGGPGEAPFRQGPSAFGTAVHGPGGLHQGGTVPV